MEHGRRRDDEDQVPVEISGDDPDLMKKRWQNRRRMSWVSLISMTVVTYLILFTNLVSVERLGVLGEVITWYYFCSASIIGMYMGATTWASIKGKQ